MPCPSDSRLGVKKLSLRGCAAPVVLAVDKGILDRTHRHPARRFQIQSNERCELNSDDMPAMNWTLVNELGVKGPPGKSMGTELYFPAYAAKSADGTYLIGDELGTEKLVPFRFESRTIRVNREHQIIFDSLPIGIHDGIGCQMDNGFQAILRRTKWELLIVSPQGVITECLPLWSISKRMPRYVCWTERATFLIVFCNRVGEVEITEIDRQGRLLWFLKPSASQLGLAGSIQWLPADTFLIADPFRHVAIEIDRGGNIVWQFGVADDPSKTTTRLSSPNSARLIADGRRLIADTRNHRVLLVDDHGSAEQLKLDEVKLSDPAYATELSDGNFLICDTGNRRVVETDPSGHVVWQFENVAPPQRILSYPRSVEWICEGTYMVADTANDRVVEIAAGQVRERPIRAQRPLFWPRCARPLPSGGMLVADGRTGRIIEVAAEGQILRELTEVDLDGPTNLSDPHDVQLLPDGHLLIADSAQDLVVEADWSGRVYRAIGNAEELKLKDPHSAQQLDDGCIVIADTGNHRILFVGPDGACVRQLDAIDADGSRFRLNFPRHVEIAADGTMVIADTGHNRILAATREGRFLWEFSCVPGTHPGRLNQPRWAKRINRHELLICDHFHHRILHVRCDEVASN